jgi:hypothetical protein
VRQSTDWRKASGKALIVRNRVVHMIIECCLMTDTLLHHRMSDAPRSPTHLWLGTRKKCMQLLFVLNGTF